MRGSIYLGGGGSEADEAPLWSEAFPVGATVAIWPFAQTSAEKRQGAIDWMSSALNAMGHYSIQAWEVPEASSEALDDVDVVAIPGGNTFRLLEELVSSGLIDVLRGHIDAGGAVYGGSAGAILAGRDIGIASSADTNDTRLDSFRALDYLDGLDVLPHYTAAAEHMARAHSLNTGRSVLCLPETSGVISAGTGKLRNIGASEAYVVHSWRTDTLRPLGG